MLTMTSGYTKALRAIAFHRGHRVSSRGGSEDPRLRRWHQPQDAIVGGCGAAAAVTIIGRQVQIAVGTGDHVPKASEPVREKLLLRNDSSRGGVQREAQQVRASQRRDEEISGKSWKQRPAIERR